ncbi:MAG: YadA-like family protein, partial [Phascolarctobacterium sp.]|nr:YadA-like family protein [Phascolarctobacterium sp.]
LSSRITNETNARVANDNALSSRITNETNARVANDNALSSRITNETNARINADQLLQNQIDTTNDRTGGITRNPEDTITTIEDNHQFYKDGNVSLNNGKFTLNSNGDTYTAGSATVQKDLGVHGDAYIGSGNNGQTVIRDNTSGYSEIIVNQNAINQVLINENGIKVGKNSSVMDTNGVYAGGDTFDQAKAAISATGELKGASGKFQVTSDGNTTITGILDVTSTSGQFAVKDDYVATRVTRGTSNNATTASSINTGSFIGERVKNNDGSKFTATGKNTDGIINVAYKDGIYTDVLQTSSGIKVITKSANDNTFGSQTDIGTKITGTDVSIEDPKNTSNRIYLSDVGQVKNVNAELKANSNYVDSPTVVGAINAEADIRRAQFAKLGNKIEKVGAGAAALAAMHPLDFDPDDKLQFSAGVGNYGGETATALGAFYRPTEKVMFNIAGTMGNDENMMNAGITFALDGRNNVSNSRVAMAREIQDLRAQVAQLTNNQAQMMALLNKVLDGQADELLANVMFPDVPENHWAYEYLDSLQKRGIIKGYPDGSFSGDRSLTRYEYAAMLCRVLDQGISVDTRLLDEFEAELGRIRIDRIKGKDNSANKIERVRVNSSSDRDDYGSKIINTSAPAAN